MTAQPTNPLSHQQVPDAPSTITCTGCPMGCQVTVTRGPHHELIFSGAQCLRGETYARQELTDPVRPLTTLLMVPGSRIPLSVKTSGPVPKALLWDCLKTIHQLKLTLPVALGEILIDNLLGTGLSVVATRHLPLEP